MEASSLLCVCVERRHVRSCSEKDKSLNSAHFHRGEEELSFLEGRELQDAGSHSSMEDQPKFTLSFKDDL